MRKKPGKLGVCAESTGGRRRLVVAAVQRSIAPGSPIGGMLFDGSGYRATFLANADLLLIATALGRHYRALSGANQKSALARKSVARALYRTARSMGSRGLFLFS
jgi:hypothetical protein